ncbi:MerC domain-containing protein [Aliidiomarina minuta]|uniref:MerC domain-containing protein n=1 Tax=Aliidiomarina minuta TaxID=880057 RepID=A0A432W4B6_9GAMM|nr:MerC domain-containing protein [Aliidiomarina minuta]RUO24109.1 MerC domain-containing protein [Aliidiomarina minuta]
MNHKPFDKTSIWLALFCALHCLLVPVLLPTLSLMGLSFLGMLWLERMVLTVSLLIGGIAVVIGMRHHRSLIPLVMLSAGGLLYFNKHAFSHEIEYVMIILGSVLIISAHVMNLHLCRVHRVAECSAVDDKISADPAPETSA